MVNNKKHDAVLPGCTN